MLGFLSALVAGAAMSIQGVMNTRLGDKVGVLETNTYVQLVGFVLAALITCFFGRGDLRQISQAPWYAWLGGVLAPVITITVMLSIADLSPTIAISTILLAQLAVAAAIDAFGIMGEDRQPFTWQMWAGLAMMTAGVVLMKYRSA